MATIPCQPSGLMPPPLQYHTIVLLQIDLMVVVMHYVINLNEDWIKPIYEQFFGILFNVSPYCWMSSVVGSAKLLALLDVFSGIKVDLRDLRLTMPGVIPTHPT